MVTLRQEIRDFITVCERIQYLLAQGDQLSADERGVVEMCGADLVAKLNRVGSSQESKAQH